MKSNVALIGFMATGKSVVGKLLAGLLDKQFVELDEHIARTAGMKIPEIFKKEGETGFREREIAAVREVSGWQNKVISCGGGVVLNWINVQRLKKDALIVLLTASPEELLHRLTMMPGERPLAVDLSDVRAIRNLLEFRQPFYTRAADFEIDTTSLSIAETAQAIADRIRDGFKDK